MMLFTPKLPVSPEARDWTDQSMDRLETIFGGERLRDSPVILPTSEFFPDGGNGTEDAARVLFRRVCGFMQVDPSRLRLVFFQEERAEDDLQRSMPHWEGRRNGTAGFYRDHPDDEQTVIAIETSRLRDPLPLVATMAHELAHVLLLGDGHIDRDAPDMEPMTDLATVFCGLGLFTANSAARFSQWDDGTKHGWLFRRLGYLPEPMFGYALASYARRRGEEKPAWSKHLNVNVGTYFRQSIRCLEWEARKIIRASGDRKTVLLW
jgi:hypothetical protein